MAAGFIHRFVPGKSRDAATLLLLHGTGGNENDLLELGRQLMPQANLLSPRGKVLENGMSRFFRRVAEGIFDEEDLIRRSHELAEFVDTAASEDDFNAQKVIAVGYSNGANIAASTLLLHPHIFAGAVLLRAMVPLVPENLPSLSGVPVFLANGENDPIVPQENSARLAALLQKCGAAVEIFWSPTGHQLNSSDLAATGEWLSRHFANYA